MEITKNEELMQSQYYRCVYMIVGGIADKYVIDRYKKEFDKELILTLHNR